MSADLILVTGATGNTGSAVLQQLREHGARVRAMVRAKPDAIRLSDPSVETVVADCENAESLDTALQGVVRAYLVTPSAHVHVSSSEPLPPRTARVSAHDRE